MYVGSLLIILVLYKWPRIGCLVSLTGLLASVAGTFYLTYAEDRPPTVIFNSPIEIEALESAVQVYTITLPHIAPYSEFRYIFQACLFSGPTIEFSWQSFSALFPF